MSHELLNQNKTYYILRVRYEFKAVYPNGKSGLERCGLILEGSCTKGAEKDNIETPKARTVCD